MDDTAPTFSDEVNAAAAELIAAHQAFSDAAAAASAADAASAAATERRDAAVAAMTALVAKA